MDPAILQIHSAGNREVQPENKDDLFHKNASSHPNHCGSVGCTSSHKMKGHRFDSRSGHMPGLWVQSPVGAHARGN